MSVDVVRKCQITLPAPQAEKLEVVRAVALDCLMVLPQLAAVPPVDGRVAQVPRLWAQPICHCEVSVTPDREGFEPGGTVGALEILVWGEGAACTTRDSKSAL